MGNGLSKAIAWLVGWAVATVGISYWLLSKVEMAGEARRDAIVGIGAVTAFCGATLALSLRKRA